MHWIILMNLVLATVGGGCKSSDDDDDQAETDATPPYGELADTELATIKEFVLGNEYGDWEATGIRAATLNSPHGPARIFFNATLVDSIEAGHSSHPKGSIVVKEVYEADMATLMGYALDVKIRNGSGANTWLFYEGLAPKYDEVREIGSDACAGCHSAGTDYLRASLP